MSEQGTLHLSDVQERRRGKPRPKEGGGLPPHSKKRRVAL